MIFNSHNQTWTVSTTDTNSHVSSVLNVALTGSQTQYAYVTLEVANAVGCQDFPNGNITYTNLSMRNGAQVYTASWTQQLTAQCNEAIVVNSASAITIKF